MCILKLMKIFKKMENHKANSLWLKIWLALLSFALKVCKCCPWIMMPNNISGCSNIIYDPMKSLYAEFKFTLVGIDYSVKTQWNDIAKILLKINITHVQYQVYKKNGFKKMHLWPLLWKIKKVSYKSQVHIEFANILNMISYIIRVHIYM